MELQELVERIERWKARQAGEIVEAAPIAAPIEEEDVVVAEPEMIEDDFEAEPVGEADVEPLEEAVEASGDIEPVEEGELVAEGEAFVEEEPIAVEAEPVAEDDAVAVEEPVAVEEVEAEEMIVDVEAEQEVGPEETSEIAIDEIEPIEEEEE